MMATPSSGVESPTNGRRPASISYSTVAEREDVRALIQFLSAALLRRHVGRCSQDGAFLCYQLSVLIAIGTRLDRIERFGETEVE